MATIIIKDIVGTFAENKDKARQLREEIILPAIEKSEEIILDFKSVDSTTQSFIHALFSEVYQKEGEKCLDIFEFRNCNKPVQSLITTVINYSLE